MKYLAALMALFIIATLSGCKQRGSDSGIKSNQSSDSGLCKLEKDWAGRMGMRLRDAPEAGGAVIDCVVIGEGLHHIGLTTGDIITGLNHGTKVSSAAGFEQAATRLVKSKQKRFHRWEFTIQRNGQKQTIKPLEKYAGCNLYTFDDCGPLNQ